MDLSLAVPDFDAATGDGIRLLVADSGVEIAHEALTGAEINCFRVEQRPGTNECSVERDSGVDVFGHGTAVAAIVRQFAPATRIDSLRVLGGDLRTTSQHVLVGLEWGIAQGYHIINCSFGTSNAKYLADYKRLVDLAFCANCILIGACNNQDFRQPDYPSSFPTVIATDHGKMSPMELGRRPGSLVEFIGCGDEVRVAWKSNQYRVSTGSSYAAPHLAAMVARIRQRRPEWNACEIKSALYRMCTADCPEQGNDLTA